MRPSTPPVPIYLPPSPGGSTAATSVTDANVRPSPIAAPRLNPLTLHAHAITPPCAPRSTQNSRRGPPLCVSEPLWQKSLAHDLPRPIHLGAAPVRWGDARNAQRVSKTVDLGAAPVHSCQSSPAQEITRQPVMEKSGFWGLGQLPKRLFLPSWLGSIPLVE